MHNALTVQERQAARNVYSNAAAPAGKQKLVLCIMSLLGRKSTLRYAAKLLSAQSGAGSYAAKHATAHDLQGQSHMVWHGSNSPLLQLPQLQEGLLVMPGQSGAAS